MAAEDGVYPARWENQCDYKVLTPYDFNELRMLMEKLQSRSSQNRNWTEIIKAVIVAITNDKRCQSDALERSSILSCVDKLQKAIKVENQQTLLEKLESIARQQSLMFNPPALPDKPACISCEMFTVEISMDTKGIVKDVRVCHQGEAMSCEELTEVLSREQYDEFSGHLEGFSSIYKIPGDKKQKSKAYLALQSLETDLNDLAQLQSSIKGVSNCIHKSPLGILLPRKGGYPMKLIYFVSPYDLLDKRSNSPHPLTVEAITEYECGQSVTVCIQQCSVSSRLQTMPLMSVVTQDGKSLPSFQALSNVNSCMLSACFVLVLPQPIPVALSVVRLIKNVTNLDVITVGEENSLITLLLKDVFKCKAEDEFFVTLPDQQHVFYMNDINGCSLQQPAVMVSKIPFTHPTNVAQVLNCLRQQLIFNTVIGSSIRPNASHECSVVFELNALSLQHMTLSFEHPLHNTMVTAEIDLSDITYPKFKVIYSEEEQSLCSEDLAGKIFQRCLSVPVTLRSVINKVSDEIRKEPPPEPVSVTIPADRPPPWPPEYYSSHFSPGRIPMDLKNISPNSMAFRNYGLQHSPQISYNLGNLMSGIGSSIQPSLPPEGILIEPPAPEKPHNPLLADLLDRNSPSPTPEPIQNLPQSEAPIMSKLLEDSTASAMASSIPQPPLKPKQVRRKRSSKGETPVVGRSPKHPRISEADSNGSLPHLDFDSSGGSFDFGDVSNPGQPHSIHSHGHPTLTRQLSIIDLTDSQADTPAGFSGESEMQKLESMVGNKLPRQPHRQDSELSQLLSDYGDTSPTKETQSPHPYYHNSVPKNDKVSTSREEKILSGSREVLKTTDPTSPNYAHQSLMDLLSIKQEEPEPSYNFQRQNSNISMISLTSNEPSNRKLSLGTVQSNSMSDLSDSDTFPYKEKSCDSTAFNAKTSNKNPALAANSDSSSSLKVKQEIKEENVHDLRTLLTIGKEKAENNVIEKDKFKKEEGAKNIRLKVSTVQGLRQSSLPNELLNTGINKKSKAPFDFHSDDDDDDPFDFRDKMKVVSSSPTRLHIHKQKLYNHKLSKEKDKKKESKNNIVSGEKRKKDKNESKKERKKKQKMMENYKSTSLDESAIYKSVTVVSEDSNSSSNLKPIPKLKINKSSLGISVGKSPSREVLTSKNETVKKSKEKYEKHLSSSKKSSSQKAYKVHQQSSPSNSITVSKADSKLITKTPTIKLKPIAMPTSSSVSVGSAKTPPAYSTASSTKGSTTPTSTTIGRMGAVSLTKSGSLTPPASVKANTPTSLSKSFPSMKSSSKSTSSLPSAAKIPSQRSNSSSSNRGSSDNKEGKKERNGSSNSSKTSSVRKSSSPMAGSRNPMNLSKSSHSSNKNLSSSTSSPFSNKNQSADVLSFLNRDSSVIANLPKIPKMAKTNTAMSSGTNKSQTTESISKAVTSSVALNSKANPTSTVSAKTNLTNSSLSNSKSAVSTSVSNSRTNSVQNTKPSVSTSSSPAHTKTVTTPTSVKQNPFITKSNNVIPSCSGGFSRSVTTVTCTTSSSSKLITSTSSTTSSKMATSVSPSVTSSVSRSSSSNLSTSVSKSVSSSSSSGSDSLKKTTQNSATLSSGTIATGSAQNTSQLSSNPVSHKSRPRKGSLTAVIDKLTKQTSYEFSSEDVNKLSVDSVNQESSLNLSSLNESDKNVVNCRTEKTDVTLHNSKSGQDKISKDSNVQGKIRKDDKEVKNNNSSPKTKSCENVKKHSDSPSKTNSGKENKNDDSRNLFTSILKSASENSYSPKDKGSKSNDGKVIIDLSKSEESGSTSEVRNSNTNCEMESSQCEKVSNTNKHSRTPSPKQNPKKFNGETVTRESVMDNKSKDSDVFKVPTPKAHNSDDKDIEDTENYVIRKKQRISTSKPVLSPSSPVSSPELVIDCQTLSPRTLQNKTNSPNIEVSSDKVGNNTILKTKNVSPIHKVKQSQLQSPVLIKMEHHSASPTEIDDDLMNEALIGFGS